MDGGGIGIAGAEVGAAGVPAFAAVNAACRLALEVLGVGERNAAALGEGTQDCCTIVRAGARSFNLELILGAAIEAGEGVGHAGGGAYRGEDAVAHHAVVEVPRGLHVAGGPSHRHAVGLHVHQLGNRCRTGGSLGASHEVENHIVAAAQRGAAGLGKWVVGTSILIGIHAVAIGVGVYIPGVSANIRTGHIAEADQEVLAAAIDKRVVELEGNPLVGGQRQGRTVVHAHHVARVDIARERALACVGHIDFVGTLLRDGGRHHRNGSDGTTVSQLGSSVDLLAEAVVVETVAGGVGAGTGAVADGVADRVGSVNLGAAVVDGGERGSHGRTVTFAAIRNDAQLVGGVCGQAGEGTIGLGGSESECPRGVASQTVLHSSTAIRTDSTRVPLHESRGDTWMHGQSTYAVAIGRSNTGSAQCETGIGARNVGSEADGEGTRVGNEGTDIHLSA